MKGIDNSRKFFYFMFGAILFCSLSIVPVGLRFYNALSYTLPIIAFTLIIGGIIWLRPGFFVLVVENEKIKIKIHPTQTEDIILHISDFAGFKIAEEFNGINIFLTIIRKSPIGLQQSEPFKISFLNSKEKEHLVDTLNKLRGIHNN